MGFGIKSGVMKIPGYFLDQISYYDRKSKLDIEIRSVNLRSSSTEMIGNIEQLLSKAVREHLSRQARENLTQATDALWRTLMANRIIYTTEEPPSDFGHRFEVWRLRSRIPASFNPGQSLGDRWDDYVYPITSNLRINKSRFFITREGRMGLGPPTLNEGDAVVILEGGGMPFILRKKGNRYQLIGCAYVHGVMKGEAFTAGLGLKREYFTLK
jgi:hypothetical protein